jgi:hypothetical protein
LRNIFIFKFDSALTSCAFQEYQVKELKNRVLNRCSTSIGISWNQHKSFVTEKNGIQPVYTLIRTAWTIFEKQSKEGSDLMTWFSSISVGPPPIYFTSSSLGQVFLFHSLSFHSISTNSSRRPPFLRQFERSKVRNAWEETKTDTKQYQEFESSLFILSLLFLIIFAVIFLFLFFVYLPFFYLPLWAAKYYSS